MSDLKLHRTHNMLATILPMVFVFLFSYAAVSKLIGYSVFKDQLTQVPLLSEAAHFLVWAIPVAELMVVILLLWPSTRGWGILAFIFLMLVFTIYLIYILNFSPYVPCSCGGVISGMGWKSHILFNLFFIGLAVLGILTGWFKISGKQRHTT